MAQMTEGQAEKPRPRRPGLWLWCEECQATGETWEDDCDETGLEPGYEACRACRGIGWRRKANAQQG